MPASREPIIADEFGRITLPWSPVMKPRDRYRLRKIRLGKWKLTLLHAESLPTAKFSRVLRVLKNRVRSDIHIRQYIRHWLHTFRADRGSCMNVNHEIPDKNTLFSGNLTLTVTP